jgi:hypothetical protein
VGILIGVSGLGAASAPTDCRQQLLVAYHKLTGSAANGQTTYHLQFVSTTQYQAPGQRTKRDATVHGEYYAQGNRLFFQTDDMSLWQDGRYVATTLRSQRTVLLTRMVPGQATTDPRRMLLMRDSLLQLGRVLACRQELQGKLPIQHIQLGYDAALAARLHLTSMEFWLTPQQTLQQVRIHYAPGNAVQQVTARFPVQEHLTNSDKLPLDARRQVVNEQGRLLPAYQGYRLVDQIKSGQ